MRRLKPAWMVFGSLLLAAGFLAADDAKPRENQPAQAAAENDPKSCVAVVGHVAQPGVYETDEYCPLLTDVVRQAGGLTADASRNARIIRQGRPGQQTYFSSRTNLRLFPGDVIIVEGSLKSRRERNIRLSSTSADDAAQSDAALPPVEIALVNLVDHPVVIQMPAEQASLIQIISYLNQGAEILPTVHVIENSNARLLRGGPTTPLTLLESGTVLIFNPAYIAADRLPTLPEIHHSAATAKPSELKIEDSAEAVPVATPAEIHPDDEANQSQSQTFVAPGKLHVSDQDSPAIESAVRHAVVEPTPAAELDGPTISDAKSEAPRLFTAPARLSAAVPNPKSSTSNLLTAILALIGCTMTVVAFAVLWSISHRGTSFGKVLHNDEPHSSRILDERTGEKLPAEMEARIVAAKTSGSAPTTRSASRDASVPVLQGRAPLGRTRVETSNGRLDRALTSVHPAAAQ